LVSVDIVDDNASRDLTESSENYQFKVDFDTYKASSLPEKFRRLA